MDFYKLKELQQIAFDRKRVICAWRPANLQETETVTSDMFIWDTSAKPEEFKVLSPHSIKVVIEKTGDAVIFDPSLNNLSKMKIVSYQDIPKSTPSLYTFRAAMRGDRKKNPDMSTYRSMTFEEAKSLQYGDHPYVKLNDGRIGTVKVNGKVRLWKRDPSRVEIPCKYGLYECYTFTARDFDRLLVKID